MKKNILGNRLLSLCILAGIGLAGPAWAADDSKEREERRVLKAEDFSQQDISDAYRAAARQKRHESMAFLKDILANRAPQGEQKAEMMLRLAELYFEEGRDIYYGEMKAFEKEFDACFNTPGCDAEHLKADNGESRKWQDKAIKLYQQILQSYPQYQRADEATFFLASALQEIGERDESVREFTRLVKTYPESKYVADAFVQIGEYFFDNNNAYKALLAYQKATHYKDSDRYPFALYKLAWCYYNVGEYGKGIDTMKTVVAYSMTGGTEGGDDKQRMTLQEEALKDLVRFFADAGEMDEAYAYFNKLGKKELIRDMLKRLATTYFEQGKFEQCIQTYRRLIAEDPNSADAPGYQNEVIQAYQKIGKRKETMMEIDRMLKTYGKSSAWARANSANQDALRTAETHIEKNLRTVAINYHDEAKKLGSGSGAKEAYALAYQAYKIYIQEFPTSQHSYEVRYAFGELLYKVKKYDEAYEQYMEVVKIDPKGQHSKFCADSAIFAAEEMIKKEKSEGQVQAPDPANKTKSVELSLWEKNLVTACDQYATVFPDDSKTKVAIYKSAQILYEKNHFKEASDRFRTVIKMDPSSKQAMYSANLILDSFNLIEDWKNLKEVSKAFYDQEKLGDADFKKEVYNVYERASFKLIEVEYQGKQDYTRAASEYVLFYEEFPKSEVADLALNNAAVYFHKTKQVAKAMEARQTLIDNFPKSKYYNGQVAALGFDYESIADFSQAAFWYEKLYGLKVEKGQEESEEAKSGKKEAIYSAGLFRRALGEWQKAISDFDTFIADYGTDERVPALMIDIAKTYEENGDTANASKRYFLFYTKPPANANLDQVFFARLQYGLLLEKEGQQSKADKHWKETLAEYDKARAGGAEMALATEFIAQIMYKQAQAQLNNYLAMQVAGPGDKKLPRKKLDELLLKQLKDKIQALKETEATFLAIVQTGAGEWGLASLIALGQAYENMSDTLKNSWIPDYLTSEQAEMYKMSLEDQAFPQVEKAVNAYSAALTKSFELNLYNENTAYATRRLGVLRPNDYPGLFEEIIEPRFVAKEVSERPFEETP